MTVTLRADQCPLLIVPSSWSSLASADVSTPTSSLGARTASQGAAVSASTTNYNGRRADVASRIGAGCYAVHRVDNATGLTLVAGTGLSVTVKAGQALFDGVVELAQDTTISGLADNARSWVWLVRGTWGGVTPTAVAEGSPGVPPAAPAGAGPLLGSVVTAGGVVTAVDESGVLLLRGGRPYRQTADTGQPVDTPPSGLVFETVTSGGVWLWGGAGYRWAPDGRDTVPDGSSVGVPGGTQATLYDSFTTYGTVTVYGKKRVI